MPLPNTTGTILGKTPDGRPIILNEDGSISTERTITITDPRINKGLPTNIPTMFRGKEVDPELAIKIIEKYGGIDPETGKKLPAFKTIKEAEKDAIKRSQELGILIEPMLQKLNEQKQFQNQRQPLLGNDALKGNDVFQRRLLGQ